MTKKEREFLEVFLTWIFLCVKVILLVTVHTRSFSRTPMCTNSWPCASYPWTTLALMGRRRKSKGAFDCALETNLAKQRRKSWFREDASHLFDFSTFSSLVTLEEWEHNHFESIHFFFCQHFPSFCSRPLLNSPPPAPSRVWQPHQHLRIGFLAIGWLYNTWKTQPKAHRIWKRKKYMRNSISKREREREREREESRRKEYFVSTQPTPRSSTLSTALHIDEVRWEKRERFHGKLIKNSFLTDDVTRTCSI